MTNKINVISNPNSYIPMTMTFNSCSVLHLQLFVGGLLFVLRYLCLLPSNTYRAVFLLCYSSSCVPYVTSFFRLSICNSPFGFLWRLFTKKKVYPKINHVTNGIITVLIKMFVLKEPYFWFHSTWCICVTTHIRYNDKVSTFLEYLERKGIIFPELFSNQMDIKPN